MLDLFARQTDAWNDRVFWGSESHLIDEWSGSFPEFLDYEERLHSILSQSQVWCCVRAYRPPPSPKAPPRC